MISDRTVFTELGWRAHAFNVAFWTLFGGLQASSGLLLPRGNVFPYPGRLIASALATAYLWALLTPAIFRLAARVAPDRGVRLRRVTQVLLIGAVVGAVATAVASTVHGLLIPPPSPPPNEVAAARQRREATRIDVAGEPAPERRRGPRIGPTTARGWPWPGPLSARSALRRWYVQEVVTFFGVFAAGLVIDLSRRSRARERQAAELQAQLAEARLVMLRTRLNPHFLFNTLNAVSALVAKDPKGVRDMIALLSELLRHALAETRAQEIPLREELRLLRLYLEILEIRYQGQLRTVMTIDPDVHEVLVPNLILQPLVENAMKHGVDRAGGHGTIEVQARRAGRDLVLTVGDTGPGDVGSAPSSDSTGIGLRLTRDRLAELYGTEQRLELTPSPDGGMRARIILPYHVGADARLADHVIRA